MTLLYDPLNKVGPFSVPKPGRTFLETDRKTSTGIFQHRLCDHMGLRVRGQGHRQQVTGNSCPHAHSTTGLRPRVCGPGPTHSQEGVRRDRGARARTSVRTGPAQAGRCPGILGAPPGGPASADSSAQSPSPSWQEGGHLTLPPPQAAPLGGHWPRGLGEPLGVSSLFPQLRSGCDRPLPRDLGSVL